MLCSHGVERSLLLLDFGLQDIGRVGLTNVGKLPCGLGGIGCDGVEVFVRLYLLLQGERGVEGAFDVSFDALLLRGETKLIGALLLAKGIAAQTELAAERDGLLNEAALLTAAVGTATNLIALVADHGIGQHAGLFCLACRLCDGGLGGPECGVVGAGECQQGIEGKGRAAGGLGENIRLGGGLEGSLSRWTRRRMASASRAWYRPSVAVQLPRRQRATR